MFTNLTRKQSTLVFLSNNNDLLSWLLLATDQLLESLSCLILMDKPWSPHSQIHLCIIILPLKFVNLFYRDWKINTIPIKFL